MCYEHTGVRDDTRITESNQLHCVATCQPKCHEASYKEYKWARQSKNKAPSHTNCSSNVNDIENPQLRIICTNIYSIFIDAAIVEDTYNYSVSDHESERMWKKAIVAKFKILFWHLPADTQKNHENCHSEWLVSTPKFELGISSCEQERLPPDPLAKYKVCFDPAFSFLNECGYKALTLQKAVCLLDASKIQGCFSPWYCYSAHFSSNFYSRIFA